MSNLIRQGDTNLASFGQFGYEYLAAGESYAGNKTVIAIQSLSDVTAITALGEGSSDATDSGNTSDWQRLNNVVLCCGVTVFGRWKAQDFSGSTTAAVAVGSDPGAQAIIYFAE